MTSPCENTQPFISMFQLSLITCLEFHGSGPFSFHPGLAHLIVDTKIVDSCSGRSRFEENSFPVDTLKTLVLSDTRLLSLYCTFVHFVMLS